jgi:hypothetical protein
MNSSPKGMIMRIFISALFWLMLIVILPVMGAYSSVFSDPSIPHGEQIVWRASKEGKSKSPSIITWSVRNIDGRPVYEITTVSGEYKQAKYIVDKADMRLLDAQVSRNDEKGRSEVSITIEGNRQCLISIEDGRKPKEKRIDCSSDGYNGVVLPFILRGFPFEAQEKVKLRLTPPYRPGVPFWAWRMWKSYAKYLGTETVTVPAGTFDCYKLEVSASGGLIKRVTSKYYFWYDKEPPHQFVRYQDEDGESVTELIEVKSNGEEL